MAPGIEMTSASAKRVKKLRTRLHRDRLDAILITSEPNVRYLSGFTGDSSALLVSLESAVFITDFRYVEQAADECPGWRVARRTKGLLAEIVKRAKRLKVASIGIEADVLTLDAAEHLRERLGRIRMEPTLGVVRQLRMRKDRSEIAAIQRCVDAAEMCLARVKSFLVPGIRERDIAAEMEYIVRGLGFDGMSFPPIVAFGERGSLPHARCTSRRMKAGDPVLIDWGVRGAGYCSDLTRVLFHHKISPKFERIYRVVLDAQRRAIRRIRPGARAKDVDATARKRIEKAGFGRRFGHGLGHGLGLEVHEGPSLASGADLELRRGMVVTVEPGVYIPGFGGVRIEDDVVVTSQGVRVLSSTPKGLKDIIL
jgi:Xaa-Pro aminopeptidase